MPKKSTIGTGSDYGTYKWGDPHPRLSDRVFSSYVKQNGKCYEQWMTRETWEKRRESARRLRKSAKDELRGREYVNPQTGSEKGTYTRRDKHPSLDLVFWSYSKNHNGEWKEYWVSPDKFQSNNAAVSENNAKRRVKVGTYPEGRNKELYAFRDLLNSKHSHYMPHTGMFHIDHVEPISRGGKHESSNLRLTTAAFNLSKGCK